MIQQTYYEVSECYDRNSRVIARFSNLADAKKLAATSPYYACYAVEKSIVIFESLEELDEWKKGDAKRAALAKLTPSDRIALGLA